MSKRLFFTGASLDDLRAFPEPARRQAGYQLSRVQDGLAPNDWRPMKSIGAGVREIRIRDGDGAYRVIYLANIGEAVFVLHAFEKKAQQTPKRDIDLAKKRLRELQQELLRTRE